MTGLTCSLHRLVHSLHAHDCPAPARHARQAARRVDGGGGAASGFADVVVWSGHLCMRACAGLTGVKKMEENRKEAECEKKEKIE